MAGTQAPGRPWYDPARLIAMFVAAFLATLIFHQGMFAVLHSMGMISAPPYPMTPTMPFGMPQVISLAFWGGVWGFVFSWAETKMPAGVKYWIAAFLFGAIFPTLVTWFVVSPLKGNAVASGFVPARMIIGPLVNGAWGIGTALIYLALARVLGLGGTARATR